MSVTVYESSVSSNMEIKKHQQKIRMILDSKKIDVTYVDIASEEGAKEKMRAIAGNDGALPPQIANGDQYCGDFAAFEAAVEAEDINGFLKL